MTEQVRFWQDKPWTMEWSGPVVMLPFEYGKVRVVFTNGSHAHVQAHRDGDHGAGRIWFKDTTWYAAIDLFASSGWAEDSDNPEISRHRHTPTSRDGRNMAPSYRAKVVAAITKAVARFVKDNPLVLVDAERNTLQHQLVSAEGHTSELRAQLSTAEDLERRLREQLAEVATKEWELN